MTARTPTTSGSGTMPILVSAERVRALVVGGGVVATRRLASLLDAGVPHVRIVAAELSPAIQRAAEEAGAGRVELTERPYESGDIGDANLVVAATDVRDVNARVVRDADAAGRLATIADAPSEGAWTSMATHRAGSLVVAVSAGGVPTAAARVRDAIAIRFDGRYAAALSRLARLRGTLIDRGRGATWRQATDELTGVDFCEAVEQGALDTRLERWEKEGAWA
ncbi:MAG TPA: NAD(P)-dependent oxidoreductase [Gemmatimonadaceae bacterium]|nr:NAD(P)-dependent oxidoreductase [Gemmatimonadaceae bacterium]